MNRPHCGCCRTAAWRISPTSHPNTRAAIRSDGAAHADVVDPELVLFAEVDGQRAGWFPGRAQPERDLHPSERLALSLGLLRLIKLLALQGQEYRHKKRSRRAGVLGHRRRRAAVRRDGAAIRCQGLYLGDPVRLPASTTRIPGLLRTAWRKNLQALPVLRKTG